MGKQKHQHEERQVQRRHLIEYEIYNDMQTMERWLESRLQNIVWPRETLIALEIAENGQHVHLDVDLPEIEDMPTKLAAVPARGVI